MTSASSSRSTRRRGTSAHAGTSVYRVVSSNASVESSASRPPAPRPVLDGDDAVGARTLDDDLEVRVGGARAAGRRRGLGSPPVTSRGRPRHRRGRRSTGVTPNASAPRRGRDEAPSPRTREPARRSPCGVVTARSRGRRGSPTTSTAGSRSAARLCRTIVRCNSSRVARERAGPAESREQPAPLASVALDQLPCGPRRADGRPSSRSVISRITHLNAVANIRIGRPS